MWTNDWLVVIVSDNSGYYQHDATGDTAQPYIHDQTGEIHFSVSRLSSDYLSPGQYKEIHPGQAESHISLVGSTF